MQFTDFIQYVGWVVAGGFAIFTAWDKATRGRHQDADQTANNLINNLKTTVDLNEKKMKETREKLDQTTMELHVMQGRNSVLEGLFNGSENSIMAFLKEMPKLIKLTEDNNRIANANTEATTHLTTAITNLLKQMTPQTKETTTTVKETTAPVQI